MLRNILQVRVPRLNQLAICVMGMSAEALRRAGLTTKAAVRLALVQALTATTADDDATWGARAGWLSMLQALPSNYLEEVRSRCLHQLESLGLTACDLRDGKPLAMELREADAEESVPEPMYVEPRAAGSAPATAPAHAPALPLPEVGAAHAALPMPEIAVHDEAPARRKPKGNLSRSFLKPQRGRFPWSASKKKTTAHLWREDGTEIPVWVQGSNPFQLTTLLSEGYPLFPETSAEDTYPQWHANLLEWLQARPALKQGLHPNPIGPPPGLQQHWGHQGQFLGFNVRNFSPVPESQTPTVGYHACSMYTLASALHNGLQDGWDGVATGRSKEPRLGIYNHIEQRVALCNNYMLHTFLDDTGWAVGPLIELHYPWADPRNRSCHVRRKDENTHQCITWPDVARISRIWFHAVHSSAYTSMPKCDGFYTEGFYQPDYEIDPAMSWEETQQHSARLGAAGSKRYP